MIKGSASLLKVRFATVRDEHIKRWEKHHPDPVRPEAVTVLREMNRGQFTVLLDELDEALTSKFGQVAFVEVIVTPAMEKHGAAVASRKAAREKFIAALDAARDAYQDRVLFDGESAFILIRDFQNWRETKAPLPENPQLSGA